VASTLALTLSACTSPRATTSKGVSTSTTMTPPPITTTTESGSSTTPTAVNVSECVASDLRPSWDNQGTVAAGTIFYGVNLENISAASCTAGGYFGVSAYNPSGTLVTSRDYRDSSTGNPPEVTVSPGGSVSLGVGFVDGSSQGACTTVGALHLISPNTTTELQIATPLPSAESTVSYPSLCEPRLGVETVRNGIRAAS
jgi:Protein of unknown function (DUF4232)